MLYSSCAKFRMLFNSLQLKHRNKLSKEKITLGEHKDA